LARWRNYFFQILSVHGVSDFSHREIYIRGTLVLIPSAFQIEVAIETLKSHRHPDIDQIPAELFKSGDRIFSEGIKKIIFLFRIRRNSHKRDKTSITLRKAIRKGCSNYRGISLLPTMYKIVSNIMLPMLTPYTEKIFGKHQ
jgi:hypothetical protein